MHLLKIIKQKKFIFNFILYNILIFIIITSSFPHTEKLFLFTIIIFESYYFVAKFKKIGIILVTTYNVISIINIFNIYHLDSLYHSTIILLQITIVISSIIIYIYVKKNENYKNELSNLSVIDSLCNIYNNKYYKKRIVEEISRAERIGSKLGLLIFDIDNFKNINNTYNYYKGDFVLKTLSNEISKIIRIEDVFCRYSSDKFIVIITEYNDSASEELNKRFFSTIDKINKKNILSIDSQLNISIGIAIYPDDTNDILDLFKQADYALLESKKNVGTTYTLYKDIE
jgi:diguanylate cyclase (GGDEF)-like protein